ncbi:uncharacterized protein LOC116167117 [Photinus pyralis]|uniref:uncharacterized protein LOC116167117 n=1 Tax=Photinus pyralis TaxID=7054 RepID=UPI0012670B47|nr:uncharacterized protein LOC116167117 [Photinus pyralis]
MIFDTDHVLFKTLKEKNYTEDFKEFVINSEVDIMHKKGNFTTEEKKVTGVLMPIKFQLKSLFERKHLLENTLQHMTDLQSHTKLTNFVQGNLWKEKISKYPNKIVLPYFIYTDDFEINDPLGSHSGKHSICNIYYSFPCLPVDESKQDNIFYCASIKSKDVREFGNEKCLQTLIQTLKELEIDGIDIQVNENVTKRVYFILGLVLGDNLGLNSFLDFTKSFSANFYCRLCRVSKTVSQKMTTEDQEMMRTIINYNADLANLEDNCRGIIKNSPLNEIPSFHVVKNFYVDIMHDIFEGVCHYSICHVILYCIEMNFFSLEILNSRKQNFEYGSKEISNISASIKPNCLNNKKLKMTARQMMTFISFFPLMKLLIFYYVLK